MGNHKRLDKIKCLNCLLEFHPNYAAKAIYCSHKCHMEYNYKLYIIKWKNKEEDGNSGKCEISEYIRRYLFDKFDNKCQKCGWGEVNTFTNKVPLLIHHVDGDCTNNIDENNLELLCPNCHSLTETFGSRNKNSKRTYRINGVLG